MGPKICHEFCELYYSIKQGHGAAVVGLRIQISSFGATVIYILACKHTVGALEPSNFYIAID